MTEHTTATDVATIDHQTGVAVLPASTPTPAATAVLMQHAQTMQAAHQIAVAMCASELVPKIYRGNPDNGAAAILYGSELGLNPIQSLQQIFVVNGTPAIYARTMVALVKSKGYLIRTVESTAGSVTVAGQDPRTGVEEVSTWTFERAKQAGYTSNKKYESDPQAMLYAKAATEVCRKLAPEVLLGIAYSREEMELEPAAEARPVRRPASTVGVAGLKDRLGVGAARTVDQPDPAPAAITAAQLKKMHTLLTKWGLTERDAALSWLSEQVARPLESSKDLTRDEANRLLDFIETEQANDQANAGAGQ